MKLKTGMRIYKEIAEAENPAKENKFRYLEYVEVRKLKAFIEKYSFNSGLIDSGLIKNWLEGK